MNTAELRKAFLEYFEERGHTVVPSSPLVPGNDPTLLFTNAGMVQFKETFLGQEQRPYTRATSSQRCVRAGGKHNDLENVGYTARHHTFFEMLGNFSFGDYFKKEAIEFAWEFLTTVLKIPSERLWVTVFEEDKEAEDIWLKTMKVDPKRFSRCGAKDNFWAMGDTGPCGPCTEIFYDHGPEVAGGPPGSPDEEGDRYVEVWNLVFMQYNRDETGELHPLPKPSVDTGMGLERIAAVMQGVHSNYEIDLFQRLIDDIVALGKLSDPTNKSIRVIADHIRSCAFLIADGVFPSNEGRGYVLRRIARRAIRHGHRLGFQEPFFYRLVKPLVREMGTAFPELARRDSLIEEVLHQEELQFERTLDQGLKVLESDLASIQGKEIPGETVFRLYDTYGFPVDLTNDIARERGLTLDMEGFGKAMNEQRARARQASQFGSSETEKLEVTQESDFVGYERLEQTATVLELFQEGTKVEVLKTGQKGAVVINETPFYAESGGQVGDKGVLQNDSVEFQVEDTKKQGQGCVHIGTVIKGALHPQDAVTAIVDKRKRLATARNHSATHLLHAVLRKVLGEHVQQKGSLVEPERLRFDFSHPESLRASQLEEIESLVNQKILENTAVETKILPIEEALKSGAMALFGEKYDEQVRVLHMDGDFSVELCGGTHVRRTGDIGLFKIVAEYGIASGVRRLEALTGEGALAWVNTLEHKVNRLANVMKCSMDLVEDKLQQFLTKNRQLEKEFSRYKSQMAGGSQDFSTNVREIRGLKVLSVKLPLGDMKALRETMEQLRDRLRLNVVVLGAEEEGKKVNLVAGVSKDTIQQLKANELVNHVAQQVGGKGGGRADMAQAGGNEPEHLTDALDSVYSWVEKQL